MFRCFPRWPARLFVLALGPTLGLALCGSCHSDPGPQALRVFSAASFAAVVSDVASALGSGPIVVVPGPSNALAAQLVDGAPGDLFLSASPEWVDWLERSSLTLADRRAVAHNALVCVVPEGSDLISTGVTDLASLAESLAPTDRVAIGAEGVPVGDYARQALAASPSGRRLDSHLVGLSDAGAVLRAVESGQVRAGFVYRTDAVAGGVRSLFAPDPATYAQPQVIGVVLSGGANRDRAREFLGSFASPPAQAILREAGYRTP